LIENDHALYPGHAPLPSLGLAPTSLTTENVGATSASAATTKKANIGTATRVSVSKQLNVIKCAHLAKS